MKKALLLLCALSLFTACRNEARVVTPALPEVSLEDLRQVAPGPGFPSNVTFDHSLNNLDIIDFDGKMFLALRTSPNHFASPDTVLYVFSTTNEKTWDYEATFTMATDLREPRFFAWEDNLYLYFASLGTSTTTFEPGQMFRTKCNGPAAWTKPESVFEPGFIPWRIKYRNGAPYMTGYTGGADIYSFNKLPALSVYLLTTENGEDWVPVNPDRPVVYAGGGSETDIEFDDAGNLWAIVRNEAGDDSGFGSNLCKAPAADMTDWTCVHDPKKYDSPLLFKHGSEIYLIGRRNVTDTGFYDLGHDSGDHIADMVANQVDYWGSPKRCAVWHVNRQSFQIDWLMDLPSRGDTCFPSALPRGDDAFLVYNYSSPVDGPDVSWLEGQTGDTYIYRMMLRFD